MCERELWCSTPPNAFGRNSRIVEVAMQQNYQGSRGSRTVMVAVGPSRCSTPLLAFQRTKKGSRSNKEVKVRNMAVREAGQQK